MTGDATLGGVIGSSIRRSIRKGGGEEESQRDNNSSHSEPQWHTDRQTIILVSVAETHEETKFGYRIVRSNSLQRLPRRPLRHGPGASTPHGRHFRTRRQYGAFDRGQRSEERRVGKGRE